MNNDHNIMLCKNEIVYKIPEGESIDLKRFLEDEIQFRQIRVLDQNFNNFLAAHIEELLKYAISQNEEDLKNGDKAFILLSRLSPEVSTILFDNNVFVNICANTLYASTNPIIISRIATILLGILYTSKLIPSASIPFVTTLTGFMDNYGVYDMFQTIVRQSFPQPDMQKQLVDLNLIPIFVAQLRPETDKTTIFHLLNTLRHASKNPIFFDSFLDDDNHKTLTHIINFTQQTNYHEIYVPQLYQLLTSLSNETTAPSFLTLLRPTPNILLEFQKPTILNVAIFDFVAKMIQVYPKCINNFNAHIIIQEGFRLMYTHVDFINLLGAIFRLFAAAKNTDLLQIMIEDMIPSMMEFAKSKKLTASKIKCYVFINDLSIERHMNHNLDKLLRKVKGFVEYCKGELQTTLNTMQDPYGGETLKNVPPMIEIPNNTGLDFGPPSPRAH